MLTRRSLSSRPNDENAPNSILASKPGSIAAKPAAASSILMKPSSVIPQKTARTALGDIANRTNASERPSSRGGLTKPNESKMLEDTVEVREFKSTLDPANHKRG